MPAESKPYTCKLDASTQKRAQEEIYEDPRNRQGAIDTLRHWLTQQKHIKCPLDDVFLLGFLRAKHFSQLEARSSLEYFMQERQALPHWMMNIDPASPDITAVINTGTSLWLGRDKEGRRVIMARPACIDLSKTSTKLAYFRFFMASCYYFYMQDELTQVNGTVIIVDFSKQTLAKDRHMNMEEKKHSISAFQKLFPTRLKALHFYNSGAMLEFLMTLASSMLSDKSKKRLHHHNNGLESLYKHIPLEILPDEYLPDEYDGPERSVQQIIASMKAEFQSGEVRERIKYLTSDQFYMKKQDKDTAAPVASFRKLNVD